VKAAEQAELAQVASATVSREKNKPNLDVKAALSLNGKDNLLSNSLSQANGTGLREASVAVTFTTPFAFLKQAEVREGYRKEAQGAELGFDRKLFEQEREWNDLVKKFEEAKKRVEMAQAIEDAQQEKLMYERDRLNRGRTTTFQVLMFEQEYALAQLGNLKAKTEVLSLAAKMKTFGGVL
jgi:outer membrane protein TolC